MAAIGGMPGFSRGSVRRVGRGVAIGALALGAWLASSQAAEPGPAPPEAGAQAVAQLPRTVADITAILDQEKPDPARIAEADRAARAVPPEGLIGRRLVAFLENRGDAASELGRDRQALDDLSKAHELAKRRLDRDIDTQLYTQLLNDLARTQGFLGQPRAARETYREEIDYLSAKSQERGTMFSAFQNLAFAAAASGDFDEANDWLRKIDALEEDAKGWRKKQEFRQVWASFSERAHGQVLALAGKLDEAIPHLRLAAAQMMQAESDTADRPWPPAGTYITIGNIALTELAAALARDGHILEAELEARRALLSELHLHGRYSTKTVPMILAVARVLAEEGRYAEAEKLGRAVLDTYQALQVDDTSTRVTEARALLGTTLVAEGRWPDALDQFDRVRKGLADDGPHLRNLERSNVDFAIAPMNGGRAQEAVELARQIMEDRARIFGNASYTTAEATGVYGAALVASGNVPAARDALGRAVPVLLGVGRAQDRDEAQPLRVARLRIILEAYLDILAADGKAAAVETAFQVADVARGQSVQHALAQSAARVAVNDPALADLVRREQDAQRQIAAETALLANAYALPADQRDDAALAKVRAALDELNRGAAAMQDEIRRRFPDFARLTNPPPATVAEVQSALRQGEALVAVYVARDHTYLWAVPKSGSPAFAVSALSRAEAERTVGTLRRALDPNAATLGDIPPFNLALSYRLYGALLDPVKAGWAGATQLLTVPHGALEQLPFALLTTAPASTSDAKGEAMFSGYRRAPWLIRRVAVTQLPSVTSLIALRGLAAKATAPRPFIGFGDPWFSVEEEKEARRDAVDRTMTKLASAVNAELAVRGIRIKLRSLPRTESVDSAQLAMLPRLPETADEVREVAVSLQADPQADVFLGDRANEKTVLTTKLDDRRVVMFATHGLVPGDLDGLTEPALALSAPQVAHVEGDGLLTVSKILGLRLNADWVVLSACNTAAGDGAGAEAVSGLGLAFFYAGSRALLVSNWPVETIAARQLTTELFRREAATPGLARGEALRQSMLALIDGPGRTDPLTRRSLFSYAHPIFWAPFSLVGDGGGRATN